jgi:glycosyltransferase involved in cell wall biosynthesis
MKILHITPHLGGGIGKAHTVVNRAMVSAGADVKQTFLLLEAPIDRRYADTLKVDGAQVIVAEDLNHVAQIAAETDIVQFEFINHPRLFECFARCDFPKMRSVIWAHISGLFKPVIQPGFMDVVSRFVFSSRASLQNPAIGNRTNLSVINSGFGFAGVHKGRQHREKSVIAYLGTVNFAKMHPGFFDVVDELNDFDEVQVWGAVDKTVAERAAKMKHPERVKFNGQTGNPIEALLEADVFFYPLQPKHYGTGENALVEAMSLGLVPVVLNNPAETEIVHTLNTGLVAKTIDECPGLLKMLKSPSQCSHLSRNAIEHVNMFHSPWSSSAAFLSLWAKVLTEPKKACDFRGIVGERPSDWFLATQRLNGANWEPDEADVGTVKGSLAHFKKVFVGDSSLSRL